MHIAQLNYRNHGNSLHLKVSIEVRRIIEERSLLLDQKSDLYYRVERFGKISIDFELIYSYTDSDLSHQLSKAVKLQDNVLFKTSRKRTQLLTSIFIGFWCHPYIGYWHYCSWMKGNFYIVRSKKGLPAVFYIINLLDLLFANNFCRIIKNMIPPVQMMLIASGKRLLT